MRAFLIAFVLLVVAGAGVAAAAWYWLNRSLDEPLAIDEPATFTVRPGTSMREVAEALERERFVADASALYWQARLSGDATRIKAGEYAVDSGDTARQLLARMVEGDVILHSLTLVEGWTSRDAIAAVQAHEAIDKTLDPAAAEQILSAIGASESHLEGLFFPNTYRFPRGTSDAALLRDAYALLRRELEAAWAERVDDLPFETPYEALILASIIEKETALGDERALIAGVFTRRLERGMRLQTDPTVIYGLGDAFDGDIRRRDLTRDTPYNTYTRAGLPPTPIALAGRAAIRASVQPADGTALFFVATGNGDGSHYFSDTLEEHEAAVRRYLAKLREQRSR